MTPAPFSGSYADGEVTFLLRSLSLRPTALEERERLIQSGTRHYSEMIGPEDAPSRERLRLFRRCLAENGPRLARDLAHLADALALSTAGKLTLVSIARAGTPMGVLLWHRLHQVAPHRAISHYSISVIRDRGVDLAALSFILARHPAESVRFIDGWTGKGTIAHELQSSLSSWSQRPTSLDSKLWVPLDVCGAAGYAASSEDYLIPSTLLGGTVSGLISRSVLPARPEESAFHGCVLLTHLKRYDLSRWFVSYMRSLLESLPAQRSAPPAAPAFSPEEAERILADLQARHGIADRNRIKLGIGETVRVLLRRLPQAILIRSDARGGDAKLIEDLAALRGSPVERVPGLPFQAVALIGEPRAAANS